MLDLKPILILFISSAYLMMFGQESSQYTLYMGQKYALNLAYAGLESSLSITGAVRSQWQELPGAPNTKIIQAQMPLYYLNGAGGIKIEQENFGAEKTIRGLVSYNYVYQSQIGLFSGGLGIGFVQKSLDGTLLKTPQGKYEGTIFQHNDPSIFENVLSGITPQLSAGLYFAQDRFEVGISLENFHSPRLKFNRSTAEYGLKPRLNLYSEYRIDLLESLALTPSLLIKSNLSRFQLDISAMAEINGKVFGGLGFRGYSSKTFDAINILTGLKINANMKVFYGFDITLSGINSAQQGTHEFMLNYNLHKAIGAVEREPIIFNPRY